MSGVRAILLTTLLTLSALAGCREAATASSRATPDRLICFGEIGLAGEIRPVKFGTERIAAAAKQGFTRAIVPFGNVPKRVPAGIEVAGVRRLTDALELAW